MPYWDQKSQKWRAHIYFEGKRRSKICATKKEAKDWERDEPKRLKAEQETEAQAESTPSNAMDLGTFCGKYLDHAAQFSPKVYLEKKRICERILEAWDIKTPVTEINQAMVYDYLDHRARFKDTKNGKKAKNGKNDEDDKGGEDHEEHENSEEKEKPREIPSSNLFNKERKNLRAMFSWLAETHGIEHDPTGRIKQRRHHRGPRYIPTSEDVLKTLMAATPEEKVLLNCYLTTGARRSEIFRLRWAEDINFESRQIRLGTKKTADGAMDYTWLPMSDQLYADLKWWYKSRPLKKSSWVFPLNRPGHFHHEKPLVDYRNFLPRICERAGVEPFQFHALRHYVASVLADTHKESPKTVQRILRHASLRTTERYLHSLNTDLRATVNLLDLKPQNESESEQGQNQ